MLSAPPPEVAGVAASTTVRESVFRGSLSAHAALSARSKRGFAHRAVSDRSSIE